MWQIDFEQLPNYIAFHSRGNIQKAAPIICRKNTLQLQSKLRERTEFSHLILLFEEIKRCRKEFR